MNPILKRFLIVILFPIWFPGMIIMFFGFGLAVIICAIPVYIVTGRDLLAKIGW